MSEQRTVVSWSSGKDSAWMLWQLQQQPETELVALVTTFNGPADRVAMHAVRRTLAQQQAQAAGLPLWEVDLPHPCSHEEYAQRMREVVAQATNSRVSHMAFGDLYLDDVRRYREERLANSGLTPTFPLWGRPTAELARQVVDSGVVAHLTSVDPRQLPREFVGRRFDHELLEQLPAGVDPCGEGGEFHTFVSAGPMFARPIPCHVGDSVERDGFVFADIVPGAAPAASSLE